MTAVREVDLASRLIARLADRAGLEHALHVARDGVDLEVDAAARDQRAQRGVLDRVRDQVDADLGAVLRSTNGGQHDSIAELAAKGFIKKATTSIENRSARVSSIGESRPLVPTADGVREPQNRRVEIVLR